MEKHDSKPKQTFKKVGIVNPHCAGIDIGSALFFVAIDSEKENVKQFGVSTPDLHLLKQFLIDKGITSVAVEATGAFETPLVNVLRKGGLEVVVTSGTNTKNYKGIKSDTEDAIHIYELHLLGKLPSILHLEEFSKGIKPMVKARKRLIEVAADQLRLIQKNLRYANVRIDIAFTHSNSVSAIKIVEAVCNGIYDPEELVKLADNSCKKTKEEIKKLLTGHFDEPTLFLIKQTYRIYLYYQSEIKEIDKQIDDYFKKNIQPIPPEQIPNYKIPKGKNTPNIPVEIYAKSLFGVDLTAIPSFGRDALLIFMAEVGLSIHDFKTDEAFSRWLKLCPNIRGSGKRIFSTKTQKNKSLLPTALRQVANAIGNFKDGNPLTQFFHRIAGRSSRKNAITALAHKLAVIMWQMTTKKQEYNYATSDQYKQQLREKQRKKTKKLIAKFGFTGVELSL